MTKNFVTGLVIGGKYLTLTIWRNKNLKKETVRKEKEKS